MEMNPTMCLLLVCIIPHLIGFQANNDGTLNISCLALFLGGYFLVKDTTKVQVQLNPIQEEAFMTNTHDQIDGLDEEEPTSIEYLLKNSSLEGCNLSVAQ